MDTSNVAEWRGSTSGLGAYLTLLRIRLAAIVLLGSGTLILRASGTAAAAHRMVPAWALVGVVLGIGSAWSLGRHLTFPSPHAGRALGATALVTGILATLLDAYALLVHSELLAPGAIDSFVLSGAMAALSAELMAFAALLPFSAAEARLAASLGASDVERRAWRAMWYVASVIVFVVALGRAWALLPETARLSLAGFVGVLTILAFAKVLGATRYVLAYLRTMHLPASEQPVELRAWHRA